MFNAQIGESNFFCEMPNMTFIVEENTKITTLHPYHTHKLRKMSFAISYIHKQDVLLKISGNLN